MAAVHDFLGIASSGSDIPALVMKQFASCCTGFYDVALKLRHLFACEKDESLVPAMAHMKCRSYLL